MLYFRKVNHLKSNSTKNLIQPGSETDHTVCINWNESKISLKQKIISMLHKNIFLENLFIKINVKGDLFFDQEFYPCFLRLSVKINLL